MSINIPPEGRGSLNLKCHAFIMGAWRECLIEEASAETQTARVIIVGSITNAIVEFRNIQNVCLKYDDGTVLKNFGSPKVSNPASLEYIIGVIDGFIAQEEAESFYYYQELDEYTDADPGL